MDLPPKEGRSTTRPDTERRPKKKTTAGGKKEKKKAGTNREKRGKNNQLRIVQGKRPVKKKRPLGPPGQKEKSIRPNFTENKHPSVTKKEMRRGDKGFLDGGGGGKGKAGAGVSLKKPDGRVKKVRNCARKEGAKRWIATYSCAGIRESKGTRMEETDDNHMQGLMERTLRTGVRLPKQCNCTRRKSQKIWEQAHQKTSQTETKTGGMVFLGKRTAWFRGGGGQKLNRACH